MRSSNLSLDRLLRAAATTKGDQPNEIPYGFDTRVVARVRATQDSDLVAVGRLLRRVVVLSLGVIAIASAGAYHELRQAEDSGEPFTDDNAIADSAIGSALEQ